MEQKGYFFLFFFQNNIVVHPYPFCKYGRAKTAVSALLKTFLVGFLFPPLFFHIFCVYLCNILLYESFINPHGVEDT